MRNVFRDWVNAGENVLGGSSRYERVEPPNVLPFKTANVACIRHTNEDASPAGVAERRQLSRQRGHTSHVGHQLQSLRLPRRAGFYQFS